MGKVEKLVSRSDEVMVALTKELEGNGASTSVKEKVLGVWIGIENGAFEVIHSEVEGVCNHNKSCAQKVDE